MGTCGQPGYVFRDFCLKQGIDFIIFCLNQGIDFINFCLKHGIFSWTINSLRVCSTAMFFWLNVLNRVSKIGILSYTGPRLPTQAGYIEYHPGVQSHLPKNINLQFYHPLHQQLHPYTYEYGTMGIITIPHCSFCLNPESLLCVVAAGCQQYLDCFT